MTIVRPGAIVPIATFELAFDVFVMFMICSDVMVCNHLFVLCAGFEDTRAMHAIARLAESAQRGNGFGGEC